jgi:hypothetical protein
MKLWISRIFLLAGFSLLLFHNVVAHHHHDDYSHDDHHGQEALAHVKIDHAFFTDDNYELALPDIVPDLVYATAHTFTEFPVVLLLQVIILPDEPYPPGWINNKTILRGPPFFC